MEITIRSLPQDPELTTMPASDLADLLERAYGARQPLPLDVVWELARRELALKEP